MVDVTYKRRSMGAASNRPRIMSKRQALAAAVTDGAGADSGHRRLYGHSAELRKALAQMQADMDAISRGNRTGRPAKTAKTTAVSQTGSADLPQLQV